MTRIASALLATAIAFLSSCASQSERTSLRQCAFAPRSTKLVTGVPDSMVISVGLEIRNPGPSAVVLDSFQIVASTSKPLARLTHGTLRRIPAGKTDTVDLRFSMASAEMLSTAFTFMMSPPDSIELAGTAWVPQMFGWWTSAQHIRVRVPYRAVGNSLQSIFKGGLPGGK